MRNALDVHRELLSDEVAHSLVRLESPLASADDLPLQLRRPAALCVAVRCYLATDDARSRFVAVAVAAGTQPPPAQLRRVLACDDIRAATAREVNAGTDYAAALVCPIGLPDDMVVLADRSVNWEEEVYTPLGEARVVLAITGGDLLRVSRARLVDLTHGRPAAAAGSAPAAPLDVIDLPQLMSDLHRRVVRQRRARPAPSADEHPTARPGAAPQQSQPRRTTIGTLSEK